MSERTDLLGSIANTIKDYRAGEIDEPTPAHVDTWVMQFDRDAQLPILREMDHVLKRTYFPKKRVKSFLQGLVTDTDLAGANPRRFWLAVEFLNNQGGGNSQHEMLEIFGRLLKKEFGISIEECGEDPAVHVYLDDAMFTGNRVRRDIEKWVESDAPDKSCLYIITMAFHSGGRNYANDYIQKAIAASGKKIDVTWCSDIELEDRKNRTATSDVLRPTSIPNDPSVKAYVDGMTHKLILRVPGNVGSLQIFSSDQGRQLLEQQFLKAGVKVRELCPYLTAVQRPLGHMTLETLGFGSLIVTFRNCPNNCPLALWAGDPWHPLFPRKTN
jgi:hypothetical protein